ncbi:probable WRKY transcription factor 53 [Ricinus communis]|uniref:WRKY transcription factor, putative n=1 Tax=Ricinus communis TaxID=3988 RepID=B9RIL9_RICCO|nr:probable WRKY transcription factor 53 [Ricinus communis]EEF48991.1 WRKY transcription factor, putative [Ricinus communis]|eukprot:XP_002513588.1 probable WRKY transcription factor 53 isoform X2 [Ricinus communis]
MESMGDCEQKNLVNELRMGRELTRQLQIHLNIPSYSRETRELLVQKILSSYEKALSMLNLSRLITKEPLPTGVATNGMPESPPLSLSGSPRSDQDSDRDFKDQDPKDVSRKRTSTARWTKQVRVNPGMGLEGPLDDGFSWRKYGQKDILGARYPRGYYRCTHRIVQGCLATKQVQRSDEDPTIFEVTYRGRHTCTQMLHYNPQLPENINQETNSSCIEPQQPENQHPSQDPLLNLRSALKVITEGLDDLEQSLPPFHFPSTSNVIAQNQVFSPSMLDNNLMGNFSSSFISPSTSTAKPNYFSASSSGLHQSFGGGNQSLQTSDSDPSDIIAAAAGTTSATDSPTTGVDFPFGNVEFDPKYFSFDNHGFIS